MSTTTIHGQMSQVDANGNVQILHQETSGSDVLVNRSANTQGTGGGSAIPSDVDTLQKLVNKMGTLGFKSKVAYSDLETGAIQVGGRNLIRKSMYNPASSAYVASGMANSISGFGFRDATVGVSDFRDFGNLGLLSLKKNTTYTVGFTAWIESSNSSARQALRVDLYPDTLPETSWSWDNGITTTPTRYTWTFSSNLDALSSCTLRFFYNTNDTSPTGNSLEYPINVTDIKLEEGNIATTWTPAPEDSGDNIKIGGRNLALNTNQGATNWSANSEQGVPGTFTSVTENGINCVKYTRNTTSVTGWTMVAYNSLNLTAIEPDLDYMVTFDIKSSIAIAAKAFSVVIQSTGGANAITDIAQNLVAIKANTWTRVAIKVHSKATLPTLSGQVIYIDGLLKSNTSANVMIRNLKFERGNKESDWTPAPNDLVPTSLLGAPSGVATLDASAHIPAEQLPTINASTVGAVPTSRKINGYALTSDVTLTKSDIGLGNVTNDAQVKRSEMGVASGVATLGTDGKVPSSQLPAMSSLALGESSSTAYRGDRGKIAYDHSQTTHAPSNSERNVVVGVQKNGTDLTPDSNRKVNVTVPTKTSELTNDSSFTSINDSATTDTTKTWSSKKLNDTITEQNSKINSKAPAYTYGTEDLVPGESTLENGKLYFVYE